MASKPKKNSKFFAHMVFFQLMDLSDHAIDTFLDACVTYLSGHPGQVHFSVGLRAVDVARATGSQPDGRRPVDLGPLSVTWASDSRALSDSLSINDRHQR